MTTSRRLFQMRFIARAILCAHLCNARADQKTFLCLRLIKLFIAHGRGQQFKWPCRVFEHDAQDYAWAGQVAFTDAYGGHDERQPAHAHVARHAVEVWRALQTLARERRIVERDAEGQPQTMARGAPPVADVLAQARNNGAKFFSHKSRCWTTEETSAVQHLTLRLF